MTADKGNDTKTTSRKRPAGKATKEPPTTLAARRHHNTDAPPPRQQIDIDLNSKSADPELRLLLKLLKPLLREVIRRAEKCPLADQQEYVAGYHNITVCQHDL